MPTLHLSAQQNAAGMMSVSCNKHSFSPLIVHATSVDQVPSLWQLIAMAAPVCSYPVWHVTGAVLKYVVPILVSIVDAPAIASGVEQSGKVGKRKK